jgi:hypothetical protein
MSKTKAQCSLLMEAHPRGSAPYRQWLSRRWSTGGRTALVVGINPNKATDTKEDGMTSFLTRLLRSLSGEFECGGFILVNCCDVREREPSRLRDFGMICSSANWPTICQMVAKVDFVVVSWGTSNYGPAVEQERLRIGGLLAKSGKPVVTFHPKGLPIYCSQTNKNSKGRWSDTPVTWIGLPQ